MNGISFYSVEKVNIVYTMKSKKELRRRDSNPGLSGESRVS